MTITATQLAEGLKILIEFFNVVVDRNPGALPSDAGTQPAPLERRLRKLALQLGPDQLRRSEDFIRNGDRHGYSHNRPESSRAAASDRASSRPSTVSGSGQPTRPRCLSAAPCPVGLPPTSQPGPTAAVISRLDADLAASGEPLLVVGVTARVDRFRIAERPANGRISSPCGVDRKGV